MTLVQVDDRELFAVAKVVKDGLWSEFLYLSLLVFFLRGKMIERGQIRKSMAIGLLRGLVPEHPPIAYPQRAHVMQKRNIPIPTTGKPSWPGHMIGFHFSRIDRLLRQPELVVLQKRGEVDVDVILIHRWPHANLEHIARHRFDLPHDGL